MPRAVEEAVNVTRLAAAVVDEMTVDVERMGRVAREGFTAAADVADVLALDGGLDYRTAHKVVGRAVRELVEAGEPPAAMTGELLRRAAAEVAGHALELDETVLRRRARPGDRRRGPPPDRLVLPRGDARDARPDRRRARPGARRLRAGAGPAAGRRGRPAGPRAEPRTFPLTVRFESSRVRAVAATTSIAYARLLRSLRRLEPSELWADESSLIREAADARLFGDLDALDRLLDVAELFVRLQETGRMSSEQAETLHEQLRAVRPYDESRQLVTA